MKKLSMLLFMMVITALIVSACSGGPSAAPSGGGQPASNATVAPSVKATAKPTSIPPKSLLPDQPTAEPTEQPPIAASDNNAQSTDVIDLPDVTEGLASLNSYESTFTMSFKGTDNNQPKEWTWSTTEQFVKDPPAKHTTVSGMVTDATGKDSTFETIEVGGKSYTRAGTMCASTTSTDAPTASNTFTPAGVIGDIKAAQPLGTDNVNGVPAKHYAVDVNSMAAMGLYTNGKSEVWVAEQGNFVVKYSFEATGKDTFFGNGSNTEGTIKWTYELKNVNQPIVIEPPKDCGAAPEDIPVMADATDQSALGTLTTYSSPSAFDDVVAFYKKEMVTKGWTAKGDGMSTEGFNQMSFTKDKRTASIMITADKDKKVTTVMITVEGQ